MRRPTRGGTQLPPIAKSSSLAREDLPAPLVYYPNHHGIFLAFAAGRDEPPALCACAEGAVHHLRRLDPQPVDYGFLPARLAVAAATLDDPTTALTFRPGLCHRCNLKAPSLRYCHEAEGTRFVQTYGWYINQTYLRLGIHPTTLRYLPEVCPPELHDLLRRIQSLQAQVRGIRAELAALMNGPRREIARSEQSHWPNVTAAEYAPLAAIDQQLSKPSYDLGNAVQNMTRAEFGFKAIGDGWVNETQLYHVICRLFPGEQVCRRHRPDWLEGLELDVYLPARKLALEYQGQQHFRPVKAWGGEQALLELQSRDARKAEICRQAGVHLVPILYTEPVTDEHIRQRLFAGSAGG